MNVPNFIAYLNQRFPVVNMALFAVLFMTVCSVAERTWPAAVPVTLGGLFIKLTWSLLMGVHTLVCWVISPSGLPENYTYPKPGATWLIQCAGNDPRP